MVVLKISPINVYRLKRIKKVIVGNCHGSGLCYECCSDTDKDTVIYVSLIEDKDYNSFYTDANVPANYCADYRKGSWCGKFRKEWLIPVFPGTKEYSRYLLSMV